jgi:hypothetical protein
MLFEISTWYDNWNETGLQNLVDRIVPLGYATRYNMAFGEFVTTPTGYTVALNQPYASAVVDQIRSQAPSAVIYAGVGDTGLAATVEDNNANGNRSTANIVATLQHEKLGGITIDSESVGMNSVAQLVTQLGPSFRQATLGIVVSVPWPSQGPVALYGKESVAAFEANVDALELQDYSSQGTPEDVGPWLKAGINPSKLMGGVSTENGNVQTSLSDTAAWTTFALEQHLRGMFSWRLDNDHGQHGTEEDVDPTFTGALKIFKAVQEHQAAQ